MNYKKNKDNFNQLRKFSSLENNDISDEFINNCDCFLEIVDKDQIYDDLQILMHFYFKIKNGLSENEKDIFFGIQIHQIFLNFFLDSSKISENCQTFLPLIFIELFNKYETECNFFLDENFLNELMTKATTSLAVQDEYQERQQHNRLLRINKLLKQIIKKHHESFPIKLAIEQYCNSLDNFYNYQVIKSFKSIIKTDEATFELCLPIFPYLERIFDRTKNEYLERAEFAHLCAILLKKGINFQKHFCQFFKMEDLFDLLLEADINLNIEAFNIYNVFFSQSLPQFSQLALDSIDQSQLLIKLQKHKFDLISKNDYFISSCHFYRNLFICFPQTLDDLNLDLIDLFFCLCDSIYKVKIEAIYVLSIICCSGRANLIQILVEKGLIDQILSVIDECQSTVIFMKSLKVIVDYSISTNNYFIQGEIFQDHFLQFMENVISKTDCEEIELIWESILKTRETI